MNDPELDLLLTAVIAFSLGYLLAYLFSDDER